MLFLHTCHQKSVTAINDSHKNDAKGTFWVKIFGAAVGWFLNFHVLAIDCTYTIRKIPPIAKVEASFYPLFTCCDR